MVGRVAQGAQTPARRKRAGPKRSWCGLHCDVDAVPRRWHAIGTSTRAVPPPPARCERVHAPTRAHLIIVADWTDARAAARQPTACRVHGPGRAGRLECCVRRPNAAACAGPRVRLGALPAAAQQATPRRAHRDGRGWRASLQLSRHRDPQAGAPSLNAWPASTLSFVGAPCFVFFLRGLRMVVPAQKFQAASALGPPKETANSPLSHRNHP
eukprot:364189-Chlamydomonas_euryale.AAC.20